MSIIRIAPGLPAHDPAVYVPGLAIDTNGRVVEPDELTCEDLRIVEYERTQRDRQLDTFTAFGTLSAPSFDPSDPGRDVLDDFQPTLPAETPWTKTLQAPEPTDSLAALVHLAQALVDSDSFVASVVGQYERTGRLSPKQINALRNKVEHKPTKPVRVQITNSVPDGTYTAVFENGSHRTFRISTQDEHASFKPGVRLVGYLAGRDNESDYNTFGEIVDDGYVKIWRRYADEESDIVAGLRVICGDPLAAAQAYGRESGRCAICGRTLTEPFSIEAGIGPVCAQKVSF